MLQYDPKEQAALPPRTSPKPVSGALTCASPALPPGLKPRQNALRVAAKTRFRMDGAERVLTKLLSDYVDEPVTVGDYTTVDGTECGYLLRVFFQTRQVGFVDVTYTDAEGQRAVMMPWAEEEL